MRMKTNGRGMRKKRLRKMATEELRVRVRWLADNKMRHQDIPYILSLLVRRQMGEIPAEVVHATRHGFGRRE